MNKEHKFFGGRFSVRASTFRIAREKADAYAERVMRHYTPANVRAHADKSGYMAIMVPIIDSGYATWFQTPRGLRCAYSTGVMDGDTDGGKTWDNHLAHFAEWLADELANPRD